MSMKKLVVMGGCWIKKINAKPAFTKVDGKGKAELDNVRGDCAADTGAVQERKPRVAAAN